MKEIKQTANVVRVKIHNEKGRHLREAKFRGEKVDPLRHKLYLDIKAITLHQLKVVQKKGYWESTVVMDV